MTFAAIISVLTVLSSLAVKLIGAPSQINHIIKTKTSKSVSLLQWVLVFSSYILWLLHGVIQKDNTLILGQGLGVASSALIIFFIIKYRKHDA